MNSLTKKNGGQLHFDLPPRPENVETLMQLGIKLMKLGLVESHL